MPEEIRIEGIPEGTFQIWGATSTPGDKLEIRVEKTVFLNKKQAAILVRGIMHWMSIKP